MTTWPWTIVLQDVTRTYAQGAITVPALRGVTLAVERGEYVAMVGASGSGKSTLMNILGCLDTATSGRYLLDGADVAGLSDDELADTRNAKIGFVFQSFNLLARTSALANVALPLAYAGVRSKERHRRALDALELVGLGDRVAHLPNELSGGQQQRVAIARAIVTDPAIILADEPTGNLDSEATEDVISLLGSMNAQGRTVVVITHEQEVADHARRLVRLRDGLVVEDSATSGAGDRLVTGALR